MRTRMITYDFETAAWAQPGDDCPAHPGQCLEPILSDSGPDPDVVGVYCPACEREDAEAESVEAGEVPYAWTEVAS